MFYLGVDGGGTKTAFMIINEEGKICGYSIKGTCHYKQVGIEGFNKIMKDGIQEVCKKSQINVKDISYSFLGLPGYGEIIEDAKNMDDIVCNILQSKCFKCGNDVEAGWAGSLACKPGINIVAGTGAIGVGVNKYGKMARASGWGHFCGDEGSAYWLGKKAIELFGKEADGRLEKTIIYEAMRRELGIKRDFDLISIVMDTYDMSRDKIATLAKILSEAASLGDKYAVNIFKEAAYEHSLTIKSIINQLDFHEDQQLFISYSGGVFNSRQLILNPLEEYISQLHKNAKIIKPQLHPITGAALYALNIHSKNFNENIINSLKQEEVEVSI